MKVLLMLLASLSFAHEGHDHGPGSLQAPKGGVLRSLETVHLELKTEGDKIAIYAYELDEKSQKLQSSKVEKYPVSATVVLPRKKPQELKLEKKGDHWEGRFDAKGAHRYALNLKITQGGHNDTVKFTVEPRK